MTKGFSLPVLALVAVASAGAAQRPASVERQWTRCRAIAGDAARLACYDAIAATPPRPGATTRVPPEIEEGPLTSTLRAASYRVPGGWTFVLADGTRWTQTDDTPIARRPVAGDAVEVRRGMLGSFRLRLRNGQAVKVKPLP